MHFCKCTIQIALRKCSIGETLLCWVDEVKSLESLLKGILTSRAETNCRGLSAVFMSGMLDSRS